MFVWFQDEMTIYYGTHKNYFKTDLFSWWYICINRICNNRRLIGALFQKIVIARHLLLKRLSPLMTTLFLNYFELRRSGLANKLKQDQAKPSAFKSPLRIFGHGCPNQTRELGKVESCFWTTLSFISNEKSPSCWKHACSIDWQKWHSRYYSEMTIGS